jgi:dihydroxyacetone kinase
MINILYFFPMNTFFTMYTNTKDIDHIVGTLLDELYKEVTANDVILMVNGMGGTIMFQQYDQYPLLLPYEYLFHHVYQYRFPFCRLQFVGTLLDELYKEVTANDVILMVNGMGGTPLSELNMSYNHQQTI